MARFAQVRQGVNPQTAHAIVVEILDDADGPLTDRFHAAFVAALVPEGPGMLLGGTWDGADFGPVPRPPSPPMEVQGSDASAVNYHKFTGAATGNAITADPPPAPPTNEEIYNNTLQNEKILLALIKSLNNGNFTPGSNLTLDQVKTIIKGNM